MMMVVVAVVTENEEKPHIWHLLDTRLDKNTY
jgi:hypothetical protein